MNDKEFLEILGDEETAAWYEVLEEEDRTGPAKNILGVLRFSFAKGDTQNSNKRIYPSEILEREVAKMKEKIEKTKVTGCLDHPISVNSELARISHLITDISWDADKRKARAEAAILATEKGRDLLTLLSSGIRLGASMRGTGQTDQFGTVQKGYELHSVDLVANPSFG
ncbi:MAG: hypothetical protein OEZ31_09960, partial [Nitrospirota bacterium]|nr:hypothetical protein [Nitrospirota bacterium]